MKARTGLPGFLVIASAIGISSALDVSWMSALSPDFMRAQFAGNAGMISGGAGYSAWHSRLEGSLNFGYVPAFAGGRSSMIFSQKTTLAPYCLPARGPYYWYPVVMGGSANVSLGPQYELILRKEQRGYYWPDALFFWFLMGTRIGYRPMNWHHPKEVSLQLEAGSINQYWEAWQSNRSVTLPDVVSLAISSQFHF